MSEEDEKHLAFLKKLPWSRVGVDTYTCDFEGTLDLRQGQLYLNNWPINCAVGMEERLNMFLSSPEGGPSKSFWVAVAREVCS